MADDRAVDASSLSIAADTSPVNAPVSAQWTFWAATAISVPASFEHSGSERDERRADRNVDALEPVETLPQSATELMRLRRALEHLPVPGDERFLGPRHVPSLDRV